MGATTPDAGKGVLLGGLAYREAAVELVPRLGAEPLRELSLYHQHGAPEALRVGEQLEDEGRRDLVAAGRGGFQGG